MIRRNHVTRLAVSLVGLGLCACAPNEPPEPRPLGRVFVRFAVDDAVRARVSQLEMTIWTQQRRHWEAAIDFSLDVEEDGWRPGAFVPLIGVAGDVGEAYLTGFDDAGDTVIVGRAVFRVVGDQTREVWLTLDEDCIDLGATCDDPECHGTECSVCREGACEEVGWTMTMAQTPWG